MCLEIEMTTEKHNSGDYTKGNTLKHGIGLGIAAAFLSALLFVSTGAIWSLLGEGESLPDLAIGLFSVGCLSLPISIPFGILGGTLVALALYHLSLQQRPTRMSGVLIGSMVGFGMGFMVLPILSMGLGNSERIPTRTGLVAFLWTSAIGALAGAWHGWQMARWLRRQSENSTAEA